MTTNKDESLSPAAQPQERELPPQVEREWYDRAVKEGFAWWEDHKANHDPKDIDAIELRGLASAAHFAGVQWALGGPWWANAAPSQPSKPAGSTCSPQVVAEKSANYLFCLEVDELISAWQAKGHDIETVRRRTKARDALNAAIDAVLCRCDAAEPINSSSKISSNSFDAASPTVLPKPGVVAMVRKVGEEVEFVVTGAINETDWVYLSRCDAAEPDDQQFDKEAEATVRAAGLDGGKINPDATSVTELFVYDDAAEPVKPECDACQDSGEVRAIEPGPEGHEHIIACPECTAEPAKEEPEDDYGDLSEIDWIIQQAAKEQAEIDAELTASPAPALQPSGDTIFAEACKYSDYKKYPGFYIFISNNLLLYVRSLLSAAPAREHPDLCCGNPADCQKACVERGKWLATSGCEGKAREQEIRKQALEEAAHAIQIAVIERKPEFEHLDPEDALYFHICDELAKVVRALSTPQQAQGSEGL